MGFVVGATFICPKLQKQNISISSYCIRVWELRDLRGSRGISSSSRSDSSCAIATLICVEIGRVTIRSSLIAQSDKGVYKKAVFSEELNR